MLIICSRYGASEAAKLSIKYERPDSYKYLEIYHALKANHQSMYGESAKYLKSLYDWQEDIKIVVTSCGYINSRYLPGQNEIFICYESLYQKVYDYPQKASSKKVFENRIYQNVMFTLWHEMGHALMDQFEIGNESDVERLERMADEFAVLSMLWRKEDHWKDILMISALHFKSKAARNSGIIYEVHPSDELRYQKMIALLYGFAQKSYSKLQPEIDQLDWLDRSAQEYYLERSAFWEQNLRVHTRRDFFNN